MKALLLSTADIEGGAARATYRLHKGLQAHGVCSQLLVQSRASGDGSVMVARPRLGSLDAKLRLSERLDALPLSVYRSRSRSFYSLQWVPSQLTSSIAHVNPDIIHLHWVNKGFVSIEALATFKQPLVWTLHDMWAFTGGCHYTQECDRYTKACGACPQLNSQSDWDLSRWNWQRKQNAWKDLNLTIVAPSHWMRTAAQASTLLKETRIEVIPNGLDTQIFQPLERQMARDRLKLPQDKHLVLFGAMNSTSDTRKGFHLLQPALQQLSTTTWRDSIELVVFGASPPKTKLDVGLTVHYLGDFHDELSLATVYAAADVFVAPSMQDNLPNTVMEAMACGIPCVTFNIGGFPDLIAHQQNGYLAQAFAIDDLTRGMIWVLEDQQRWLALSQQARAKVEQCFTLSVQAEAYSRLYQELLENASE